MNKNEIVCIGHDENAMIFNANGIKGIVCQKPEQLSNIVNDLINNGTKIIIISNKFNEEVNEFRKLSKSVYPIFLLLDMDGSKSELGYESLRKDVERATGINIL